MFGGSTIPPAGVFRLFAIVSEPRTDMCSGLVMG